MKRFAAMCLIASMIASMGCVTGYAAEADGAGQTAVYQTAGSASDETEVLDVSTATYPSDWDPEDPLNGRAYRQQQEQENLGTSDEAAYRSSAGELARSSSNVTTSWPKYNGGTTTYIHNSENVTGKNVIAGIDVSYHQGSIDWNKVKASGVQFVILRAGYRAYGSGSMAQDSRFAEYYKGAKSVGLKVGAYFYSQATTQQEAVEEANKTLSIINGCSFEMPVAFDYEYANDKYGNCVGRLYNANLSKAQKTACARAYCDTIRAAGYSTMIYANAGWCEKELDTAALRKDYQIWMARYNTYTYKESKDKGQRYGGQIDFWQCSDNAKINGINTAVDFDYWYQPASGSIVYDQSLQRWVYAIDGVIQYQACGLASNEHGWFRVDNGFVNFDFNGLCSNENGWWRLAGGKIDFDYNGFASNENGNWYVRNGQNDFNNNDHVTLDGKQYLVKGGQVSQEAYIWPLDGYTRLSDTFGERICPFHGKEFHDGVDIPAPGGTNIMASASGVVTKATYSSSLGNNITIDHGYGVESMYLHCSALAVEEGDHVEQGQVIAYVGTTGSSTGNHLDIRFKVDGEYVDPLSMVQP